jgi:hypothetical protein
MKFRKFAGLAALLALASGCTTTITNLTPGQLPRNPQNLYQFDVAFDTKQNSIREQTIAPMVIVGLQSYPMRPAPVLKNRWEALVPIPATNNAVYYQYKFDYNVSRIPKPASNSKLSPTYRLDLTN